MKANNILRMLKAKGIPYQVFDLPPEKLGAVEAAALMGVPAEQVFKTIVVTRLVKGKHILAVIPGPNVVDLKALARVLGEKKLRIPSEKQAEQITGLKAGGISPLALINRGFQVVIDEAALQYPEVYISGGRRGLDIRLPTQALIELTQASVAKICD